MSLLTKDVALLEGLSKFYKDFDTHRYLGINQWFYGMHLDLYARNYFRHYSGEFSRSLEIANVSVHPFYRKRGVYSALLEFAFELLAPGEILFIENVLDRTQETIYLNRGFSKYRSTDDVNPSYYKVKYAS